MNAWALLYDELYGDKKMTDNRVTPQESDEYDPITNIQIPDSDIHIGLTTESADATAYFIDTDFSTASIGEVSIDMSNYPNYMGDEVVTFGGTEETPTPGIKSNNTRKYNEDKSIEALQEYVSSTYGGHYTSKENNVQTLDLIESVGDAEAFCRSNAIKYLSRYDKKGQSKRDILKALHYSLLLYHFSGQLNETPTRGYETF